MAFMACLILAFGPLDWSFPWWVWLIAVLHTGQDVTVHVKKDKS